MIVMIMMNFRNFRVISFILIVTLNIDFILSQSACSQPYLKLQSIREDAPIGSIVVDYSAIFDKTSGFDNLVISSPFDEIFRFDKPSLKIYSRKTFNKESEDSYHIEIEVTCSGLSNAKPYIQVVVIDDVNEKAQWVLPVSHGYYNGTIVENSTNDSEVQFDADNIPRFKDPDTDRSNQVLLVDKTGDDSFFSISMKDGSKITIMKKKALDFDVRNTFNLTLILQDLDPSSKDVVFTDNATLIIHIIDVDNKLPVFEHNQYTFSIISTAAVGSLFSVTPSRVKAIDGDRGINATIKYRLVFSKAFVTLDPDTADLRTNSNSLESHTNSIEAYQIDNNDRKSSVQVEIKILPPVVKFNKLSYVAQVNETFIGEIIQLQLSTLKTVEFTMNPKYSEFKIMSDGGVMVIQRLGYEKKTDYKFIVLASDGKTNDSAQVHVQVLPVNEYAPKFELSSYSFKPNLTSMLIGRVKATDEDLNEILIYSLSKDETLFTINSTGELYRASVNSDVYINKKFIVLVTATDSKSFTSVMVNIDFRSTQTTEKSTTVITTKIFTKTHAGITTKAFVEISTKRPAKTSTKASTPILTTQTRPLISKQAMLTIYILVPIVLILIIIFVVLICYYKKRRAFKANSDYTEEYADKGTNYAYDNQCSTSNKSGIIGQINNDPTNLDENNLNIHDISSRQSYVSELQQEDKFQYSPIYASLDEYKRKRQLEFDKASGRRI